MNNGNGTNGMPNRGPGASLAPPLSDRLRSLQGHVPPDEISDLWVFPPLADLEDSAEFVLFTRLLPDEMRRVCAAEFTEGASGGGGAGRNGAVSNGTGAGHGSGARPESRGGNGTGNGNGNGAGSGAAVRITEYGRVPSARVSRVVDGFRRRLGDDREPLHLRIEGCPDSWDRLLAPEGSDR